MTVFDLHAHLATGATRVCHCWAITRRDGVTLGFTDHDRAIAFDAMTFQPESGLSARALSSTTGLAVNNTEAIGVLSSAAITEEDIFAGRYDGAEVTTWLVQWDSPDARQVRFYGTIGEISRANGGFQAELRGLTEALNQPQGRSYLTTCSAVLGDTRCGVETSDARYTVDAVLEVASGGQRFTFSGLDSFNPRWFDAGQFVVESGTASGLRGVIKSDDVDGNLRVITLWESIPMPIEMGDRVRLISGCDKRAETCRLKFENIANFQGFPDIPGEDWLMRGPTSG